MISSWNMVVIRGLTLRFKTRTLTLFQTKQRHAAPSFIVRSNLLASLWRGPWRYECNILESARRLAEQDLRVTRFWNSNTHFNRSKQDSVITISLLWKINFLSSESSPYFRPKHLISTESPDILRQRRSPALHTQNLGANIPLTPRILDVQSKYKRYLAKDKKFMKCILHDLFTEPEEKLGTSSRRGRSRLICRFNGAFVFRRVNESVRAATEWIFRVIGDLWKVYNVCLVLSVLISYSC